MTSMLRHFTSSMSLNQSQFW